ERAEAQEDEESAGREEERGHREVPGDLGAEDPEDHSAGPSTLARSPVSRRECEPRMTPPIAATSSTIDVISNASRWSVRNSRPISLGVPKLLATCGAWSSRPPAFRPIATITSMKIAAAAPIAPTVCHVGPPAHGVSNLWPMYAITNRNMTITAPA